MMVRNVFNQAGRTPYDCRFLRDIFSCDGRGGTRGTGMAVWQHVGANASNKRALDERKSNSHALRDELY